VVDAQPGGEVAPERADVGEVGAVVVEGSALIGRRPRLAGGVPTTVDAPSIRVVATQGAEVLGAGAGTVPVGGVEVVGSGGRADDLAGVVDVGGGRLVAAGQHPEVVDLDGALIDACPRRSRTSSQ